MLLQLLIGALVLALTVMVHVCFIGVAEAALYRVGPWLLRTPHRPKTLAVLTLIALWLMGAHSVGAWVWAVAFLAAGVFTTLEPALYFAMVSYTTLGFGDVLLPTDWRLLAGVSAANGLLVFGVSTAFMAEVLRQLRRAQRNVEGLE